MNHDDGSFLSVFVGWLYVSSIAMFGILARMGQAAAASNGELRWRQVWIAGITAPGLGVISNALALWTYPQISQQLLAGIIAAVGFLGPAFVLAIAQKLSDTWLKGRTQ